MNARKNNKKGFSLLELIIVMVVMGTMAIVVVNNTKGSSESGQITSAMQSVSAIQTASMQWFADNGNAFTGVSVGTLVTSKLLGEAFTGTSANPWGGNYSLAVNGADAAKADLTITAVPGTAATKLTTALGKKGLTGAYTAASKTYVITL
jgi:prepilin-type N-terminal cleavage/methylation domain-containing protein